MAEWRAHQLVDKQTNDSSLLQFLGMTTKKDPFAIATSYLEGGSGAKYVPTLAVELEELFVTVNMLSTMCKVLLQSYNAFKKCKSIATNDSVTLRAVFDSLPIGLKSDVANSLLEALSGFTFVWRKRFERSLLKSLKDTLAGKQSDEPAKTVAELSARDVEKQYIFQTTPGMPAIALFQLLCAGLPVAQPLQDYMERIFS
jgi:hypothetical protein